MGQKSAYSEPHLASVYRKNRPIGEGTVTDVIVLFLVKNRTKLYTSQGICYIR